MDSSLILLLAVGLTLANLVPHALRRREQLSSCRSVDRFSGAMRVLPPRTAPPATGSGTDRHPALLTSPRLDLAPAPGCGPAPGGRRGGTLSTSAVRVVDDRGARRSGRVAAAVPVSVLGLSVAALVLLAVLAQRGVLTPWALAVGAGQVGAVLIGLRLRARRRAAVRRAVHRPGRRVLLGSGPRPQRVTVPVAVPVAAATSRATADLVPARRPA